MTVTKNDRFSLHIVLIEQNFCSVDENEMTKFIHSNRFKIFNIRLCKNFSF